MRESGWGTQNTDVPLAHPLPQPHLRQAAGYMEFGKGRLEIVTREQVRQIANHTVQHGL